MCLVAYSALVDSHPTKRTYTYRTLTLKQLRKDIATELSIDEAQVKQHKELISKTVDRVGLTALYALGSVR